MPLSNLRLKGARSHIIRTLQAPLGELSKLSPELWDIIRTLQAPLGELSKLSPELWELSKLSPELRFKHRSGN
jgi:hypothetical protein